MARAIPPDDPQTASTSTDDSDPPGTSTSAPAPTGSQSTTKSEPEPEPRPYIRIRPSDDSLTARSVISHVRRLHRLRPAEDDRSRLKRLYSSGATPPTVECLLVSAGGTDPSIEYLIGIDPPDELDGLERILRGLFPGTYEFDRIEFSSASFTRIEDRDESDGKKERVETPAVTAVEYRGVTRRRRDWMTRLIPVTEFLTDDDYGASLPLSVVSESMAACTAPSVFQVLVRPKPDWTSAADDRITDIEGIQDTWFDQFVTTATGGPPENSRDVLSKSDRARIEDIEARETRCSFDVNARAIAVAHDDAQKSEADRLTGSLESAFSQLHGFAYGVDGKHETGTDAERVLSDVRDRTFHPPNYGGIRDRLPMTQPKSRGIVADATEVPSFILLPGDGLTAAARRAVAPTPGERTAIPRPPAEQLAWYRGPGLTIGRPLTQDNLADDEPMALPPSLQPLHVVWAGRTGSGKSVSLLNAILDNAEATDGPDIVILPKGDDSGREFLRAHYARHGHLEDVIYFDCAETLPAFSFFDIRADIEAGRSRTDAVLDAVGHYEEILAGIMGRERYHQAVRSPDIIRYLTRALFDPVSGQDAYSHRELHTAVRKMHERQVAPPVSDRDLEEALAGVVANRARTFDEIMAGVANRIEKIPVNPRLARIFNHVPLTDADSHFDLGDYLEEDVTIVFDTGGLREEEQRVLTLVILSNLWSALKRASREYDDARKFEPERSRPLVNLYIEEAASVAITDLLKTLLSQGRSFRLSVTLALQFPAQMEERQKKAYDEVLNDVATFVVGKVANDRELAEILTTDDKGAQEMRTLLGSIRRGQWLVTLPAPFDEPEPRPFFAASVPLPAGHPEGDRPLTEDERRAFEAAVGDLTSETVESFGLRLRDHGTVSTDSDEPGTEPGDQTLPRVDSALPYTNRLPFCVEYDGEIHALRCVECETRYDPDLHGMIRAIECCHRLEDVDPADIPIFNPNLKLTPGERAMSEWTDRQLLFLQAVYNAQQLRYDRLEYDIVWDSMIRLQEYVGITSEEVMDLLDTGILTHDTDHPHRLYTVTPAGRAVIGESYREGVDYGHGKGDLEESSQHVFGVEVVSKWLEQEYVEDPESDGAEVHRYFDIDEQRRLDVAVLDEDGGVVVSVEVERINHDVKRAVPDDYDKMADCNPDEAIWVVMSRIAGHDVLRALNDPPDGESRVEKTYSENTPLQQMRINTPGLTAIYTAEYVRDQLLDRDDSQLYLTE